ncbi:MAG: HEAT repeat domain-containing protein [Deltaproteobacteria bacterium]|nr:HEAT repeat domain-containing protein [Deltaproteobacteria bacterium]
MNHALAINTWVTLRRGCGANLAAVILGIMITFAGRSVIGEEQTRIPITNVKPGAVFSLISADPPGKGPVTRLKMKAHETGLVEENWDGAAYCSVTGWDPISGRTKTVRNADGCEQVWFGTLDTKGSFLERIESTSDYPITTKWKKARGWVYLCGRGRVKIGGKHYGFGEGDNVDLQIVRLKSEDSLEREGAAQALGWLSRNEAEKAKAVEALITALGDKEMEVRRNAAESLGRLANKKAVEPLSCLTDPSSEPEQWVREVAKESMGLIRGTMRNPSRPMLPGKRDAL